MLRIAFYGTTLLGLGLAAVSGCGPKRPPEYFLNPRLHPQWGSERYVSAAGNSEKSLVEAEHAARERVVSELGLRLSAYFEREPEKAAPQNAETFAATQGRAPAPAPEPFQFTHPELIQLDQRVGLFTEGVYYAYAHLSLDSLRKTLREELARARTAYNADVEAALSDQDLEQFAVVYHDAIAMKQIILSRARELQGLLGEEKNFSWDEDRFKKLLARREAVLAKMLVNVIVEANFGRADVVALQRKLVQALQAAGVQAKETRQCRAGDLVLKVTARPQCKRVDQGFECLMDLPGKFEDCKGKKPLKEFKLEHESFKGADKHQRQKALNQLQQSLTAEALTEILRAALKDVLPI